MRDERATTAVPSAVGKPDWFSLWIRSSTRCSPWTFIFFATSPWTVLVSPTTLGWRIEAFSFFRMPSSPIQSVTIWLSQQTRCGP